MKTFGSCKLEGDHWEIEAEPHVALRLKRVFGGAQRGVPGRLRVSDTPEHCRDITWFCTRFPLAITPRKRLVQRARAYDDQLVVVEQLLSGAVGKQHDFDLALPPRQYQRLAAEMALTSGGLLVADDLGLGKTAIGICVLAVGAMRPGLVVAPAHLQYQWADEIAKFAPQLSVHILRRGDPYDYTKSGKQLSLVNTHPDVLISSYHKLSGWAQTLAPVINSIVFDEAHELRIADSKKYQAAEYLAKRVRCRIGLTATPIFNYGSEIFSVMEVLRPGALGDFGEFKTEWCSDRGYNRTASLRNPQAFGTYARQQGLMLRRTRAEVGRELPELVKAPIHVDANEQEFSRVGRQAAELARIVLAESVDALEQGERFRAGGRLDALMRHATGLSKAPFVADFVRLILEAKERVVLYGWHRDVYDVWLERLKEYRPAVYTGTESPLQKEEAKRKFVERETPLLIMSLRSGQGIDGLQYAECRNVVFGELDWSPAVHEQDIARVHRDGQGDSVVAYFCIADAGADPLIADVLGLKKQQLDGLRDPLGAKLEQLDTGGKHIKRLAAEVLKRSRA